MKRLILHIGTYKTGSTSLQMFLSANSPILERSGIKYPTTTERFGTVKRTSNAFFLTQYARNIFADGEDEEKYTEEVLENMEAFKRDVQEFDTIILSDERLWRTGAEHPEVWEMLKALVSDIGITDIDLVVYLRRQDLFIASLWNQYVKSKMAITSTLYRFALKPSSQAVMDYDAVLRPIEEAFGRDHVMLRIFDRSQLIGGDICTDFCELVGIPQSPDFTYREDESNTRLSNNIAELKRVANQSPSYQQTNNFLYHPALYASKPPFDEGGSNPMTNKLRKRILAEHAAGNARIAHDYFGRDDGVLFTPPDAPIEHSKSDEDRKTMLRDAVHLFVEALSQEHLKVREAQAEIDALKAQNALLEKRIAVLEQDYELRQQSILKRTASKAKKRS